VSGSTSDPASDLSALAYGTGRRSPQRELIARTASSFTGAFSVEDLLVRVRKVDPGIGSATVYRAVGSMGERGFLETVGSSGAHALYLHCADGEHHHHLVCTGCGSVAHAPCPLDEGALRHAQDHGFVITHHEVSIYGLCAQCLRSGVTPNPDAASCCEVDR